MNMSTLANFVFASHSRRTQGVISSARQKPSVSARKDLKVSNRTRISRAHHLLVFCFPFAFQLQHCLKSYERGDENSYKNDKKPSCSTHGSLNCLEYDSELRSTLSRNSESSRKRQIRIVPSRPNLELGRELSPVNPTLCQGLYHAAKMRSD